MKEIEMLARIKAFQVGRAQPLASHRRVVLHEDARIVSFVRMAGEDGTIHCVAVGREGEAPLVYCVGDPRNRDAQFGLFGWLAAQLLPYFEECRQKAQFPQLWVTSDGAIGHLMHVGQRMLSRHAMPEVQALGSLLAYLWQRHPNPGQQTLLSATACLRAHYATGQTPQEDQHLGAFLAWLRPREEGVSLLDAIEEAELVAMGYQTDPAMDRKVLSPLLQAYRGQADAVSQERLSQEVHALLSPVVLQMYAAIEEAIGYLRCGDFVEEPALLGELAAMEADAYKGAFARDGVPARWNGFAGRDSVKQSSLMLAFRESVASYVKALLLRYDRVSMLDAVLSGELVEGLVQEVHQVKEGRKQRITFTLVTTQQALHVRAGDRLVCLVKAGFEVSVGAIRRLEGGQTAVTLELVAGMKKWGAPEEGALLRLTKTKLDLGLLRKERQVIAERLRLEPESHHRSDTFRMPEGQGLVIERFTTGDISQSKGHAKPHRARAQGENCCHLARARLAWV